MRGAGAKKVYKILLPLCLWLGVWQLLAWRVGQSLLLPGPWEVLTRLCELAGTGQFWATCLVSLGRVFLGGALGALLGMAVAALSAWKAPIGWALSPLMKIVRATPVASFILLIWLWCSSGWVPVVIAALMSAPVVWSATAQGIESVDPKLLELGRAYRFDPWKTVRLIYIPSARSAVAAGCRTAMGLAWKAGVAAEALSRPRLALGTQVYNSKVYLETADLFAWTAAVVILSFLLERCIWALWRLWERRGEHGGA